MIRENGRSEPKALQARLRNLADHEQSLSTNRSDVNNLTMPLELERELSRGIGQGWERWSE